MATALSRAKLTTASTIAWSSGEAFDGYLLVGIAMPTGVGGSAYVSISADNRHPRIQLPRWFRVPIKEGAFNSDCTLLYTADIEPPNTRYYHYWYDINGRQIAGPSAVYEVTTNPHVITPPTLTSPTAASVPDLSPEPDTGGALPTEAAGEQWRFNETPSGTINGQNAIFTLAYTPSPESSLLLFLDGVMQIVGAAYSLSGVTITFQPGYIPQTGALLRAWYKLGS